MIVVRRERKDARAKQAFAARIWRGGSLDIFATWKDAVKRNAEVRRNIRKGLMRWMLACSSKAFATWCEHVFQLRSNKLVIAKVASRMGASAGQARAFQAWQMDVRRQRGARRCLVRLVVAQAAASFSSWVDHVHLIRKLRTRCSRMLKGGMTRALTRWVQQRDEAVHRRWVVLRVANRIMRSGLVRGMEALRMCQQEAARWSAIVSTLCMRRVKTGLCRVMGRWLGYAVREQRRKGLLTRTGSTVMRRRTAKMFYAWSHHAGALTPKKTLALLMRASDKTFRQTAVLCLHAWDEYARGCVRAKIKMGQVLMRMSQRCLAKAFAAWVDELEMFWMLCGVIVRVQKPEIAAGPRTACVELVERGLALAICASRNVLLEKSGFCLDIAEMCKR